MNELDDAARKGVYAYKGSCQFMQDINPTYLQRYMVYVSQIAGGFPDYGVNLSQL